MFKGSLLCLCGIIGSDGSEPSLGLGSGLGLFGSARVRHFEKSPGSLQARARHFEKGPENLSLKVKKKGLVKARALSERLVKARSLPRLVFLWLYLSLIIGNE